MIVLWNTRYIEKVLDHLRSAGWPVTEDDVERLSPIIFKHINFLGYYHFNMSSSVERGSLRPLRPLTETDFVRHSS